MKKPLLILAAFGILIFTSCSNEVRKETVNDSTITDSTAMDTTKVADTTTMPPDTTRQH